MIAISNKKVRKMELSSQSILIVSGILASTCFLSRLVLTKRERSYRIGVVVGLFVASFAVFAMAFSLKEAAATVILGLVMAMVANTLVLNMQMVRHDGRRRDNRRMFS